MGESDLERYFRAQMVSPQWARVLRALAGVLGEQAGDDELRGLLHAVGARLAADAAATCAARTETLADLQDCANAYWLEQRWGWVELTERQGWIDVVHHAAPLAEAFGPEALGWSCGLLEGFYETLFRALGADGGMVARTVEQAGGGLVLRLRFGL